MNTFHDFFFLQRAPMLQAFVATSWELISGDYAKVSNTSFL
jgi:hypothetical protein